MSNFFAVPAHASGAWRELQEQIALVGGTPCAGPDRDLWIGTQAEQHIAAERCLSCPAMTACATYAATAHEREGTWGGLTARQRTTRRETA